MDEIVPTFFEIIKPFFISGKSEQTVNFLACKWDEVGRKPRLDRCVVKDPRYSSVFMREYLAPLFNDDFQQPDDFNPILDVEIVDKLDEGFVVKTQGVSDPLFETIKRLEEWLKGYDGVYIVIIEGIGMKRLLFSNVETYDIDNQIVEYIEKIKDFFEKYDSDSENNEENQDMIIDLDIDK